MGKETAKSESAPQKCRNRCRCGKAPERGEEDRRNLRNARKSRGNAAEHGNAEDPNGSNDTPLRMRKQNPKSHEQREHDRDRQRRPHIVARIHRRALADQSRDERHRHAEEYDRRDEYDEQHPEECEERTALVRSVDIALRQALNPRGENPQSREKHKPVGNGDVEPDVRACKRVHGEIAEDAAAREERAVEHERVGEYRREVDEVVCAPPRTRHRDQMNEYTGEQPRHEGGVLHGIPAPVAAPAEHLVRPVAADEDACAEERPCNERPAAHRRKELAV